MGKVIITADMCKSCQYCVRYCPRKVLEIGNELNRFGYKSVVAAHEENCIGCGMCAYMCPEAAIEVLKEN
jgi:2-oxoglutarate ferredoxin oxidoreductase subunit delta